MTTGKRPPRWKLPADEADAVDLLRSEVETLVKRPLHPLACRLPLPPPEEVDDLKKYLRDHGWTGRLVWTDDKKLLDGKLRLWLWGKLGHRLDEIPRDQQKTIPSGEALAEILRSNIGSREAQFGWQRWRRAVAATIFAVDVHDNLESLRRICPAGKRRLYLYDVLAHFCRCPPRYIAYALRLGTRSDRSRFLSALSGHEASPDLRFLETASERGSRSRAASCHTISTSWIDQGLPPEKRFDLFIVDLDYPPMLKLQISKAATWFRQGAHLIFLVRDVLSDADQIPHWISTYLGNHEVALKYVSRALDEVKAAHGDPEHSLAVWRSAIVFATDPHFVPPDSYKELLRGDLSKPLNQKACRERLYERLMRSFCRGKRVNVFVPYLFDPPPDQSAEHQQTLELLQMAAGRARVELVCFGIRENTYLDD